MQLKVQAAPSAAAAASSSLYNLAVQQFPLALAGEDEGFSVKAIWGRTQEEAEELAKEMSVPFYTSRIDEVLLHQDVDLVCINLPPPLTRQIAVKTLVASARCFREREQNRQF
nr:glucose-fructose oxidoreductase domain-containing protein 1-like isoform X1 [Chelonoidis abingdonii]